MLTVYGIETCKATKAASPSFTSVATVLTVYGIETQLQLLLQLHEHRVATVLTVYGIETSAAPTLIKSSHNRLQQCLPFTVLKLL